MIDDDGWTDSQKRERRKIDKYGYQIPMKQAVELKQGSGPAFEAFKNLMEDILYQIKNHYKTEEMKLNQFNLLFSAASELMSQMVVDAIERHERGETPKYGQVVSFSVTVRNKMSQLEKLFRIQEMTMSGYLVDHPRLMKEESEEIIKEMKRLGKDPEASLADMIFNEAFKAAYDEARSEIDGSSSGSGKGRKDNTF